MAGEWRAIEPDPPLPVKNGILGKHQSATMRVVFESAKSECRVGRRDQLPFRHLSCAASCRAVVSSLFARLKSFFAA
jgi:hypothetical protein